MVLASDAGSLSAHCLLTVCSLLAHCLLTARSLVLAFGAEQKPPELFAREPRNKTHHGPPAAPPASAWCVLFRVSRARKTVAYLKFAARMYSRGRTLADFRENWVFQGFGKF